MADDDEPPVYGDTKGLDEVVVSFISELSSPEVILISFGFPYVISVRSLLFDTADNL